MKFLFTNGGQYLCFHRGFLEIAEWE